MHLTLKIREGAKNQGMQVTSRSWKRQVKQVHFWASRGADILILGILTPYCCSVAQSCPTLCNTMDCSMPGFLVLHYLPQFAQTHVHGVTIAIQPSHPLSLTLFSCPQSFPALGSFPMSQFFASGGRRIGTLASASVLLMNIQAFSEYSMNNHHPH